MPNDDTGVLKRGFAIVLRHQRVLWWIFAVNLVLGGLGASGTARALGGALHHSLAGQRLTDHLDLGMFLELVSQPDVKLFSHSSGVLVFAGLYFLFLLFIMPGVITAYLQDSPLSTGGFFAAAGTFFWAFVRLVFWSLVPFILINLLYEGVQSLADHMGERALADQTGFYVLVIGCIPVALLMVWVRLWFDLAQVRVVALNELRTRREVVHTFRLALRRTWSIYWSYLLTCVFVWVVTALALLIWIEVPGRAVPATFLLLEIIMLAHIFGRLWQKACATTWYSLNPGPSTVVEQVPFDPFFPLQAPRTVSDVDAPLSPEVESGPKDS